MAKMQGAEDEGAGSVPKYMTKPESDSNEADWLLWHTALIVLGLTAKYVPWCPQNGARKKIWNKLRARGARIHLSNLYVFQGYMHFLQTLHSSGLKFDNQIG